MGERTKPTGMGANWAKGRCEQGHLGKGSLVRAGPLARPTLLATQLGTMGMAQP